MNCATCSLRWTDVGDATWDDSLRTGVQHIDDDHREMFARIDELAARGCEDSPERLLDLLRLLDRYVHAHFEAEELLMSATAYPGYGAHRQQHEAFAAEFDRLCGTHELVPDGSSCVGPTIVAWATAWLRDHVLHADAAMAAHVRRTVGRRPAGGLA